MRNFIWIVVATFVSGIAIAGRPPQKQAAKDMTWAYPVPGATPVPDPDDGALRHVPGSAKAYTQAQIEDLSNPPDWFPDEHAALPQIVQHGKGTAVLACTSCHVGSGLGHPESANLTGLSAAYIEREFADFKSGDRKDYCERMSEFVKGMSEADVREASEWFATLKPGPWERVVEADTVPKSFVDKGRMRLPLPGGGTEPLGNRIIVLPEDAARVLMRDPHSGFVDYVPVGSIAKGQVLVTTGGAGKTIACATCHGPSLQGMGDAPRIAGSSPIYIVRQLHDFQSGARGGNSATLMKTVVPQLSDDDILAIAAYVASLTP
jgi:cytochrome c553